MTNRLPTQIGDIPSETLMGWGGYYHKKDPTVLPSNVLTYPSQNCFIPDTDVIIPRQGSRLLGQAYTQNTGIIGHFKKFTNAGANELEVRVWQSGGIAGDVIDVLYPNPSTDELEWYTITETINPIPVGTHRYYFDEWFDTNLDPSLSLNLSRLIWTNGTTSVSSWTGGMANITALTGTSISIDSTLTWTGLGFVDPANGGSGYIIVRGTSYEVTSGWDTNTLILPTTSGIVEGDVAIDKIRVDTATTKFDFIRVNKNYAHYGKWDSKTLYISNEFNRPSSVQITNSQAVQNDLIIVDDSAYTGTGSHIYKVSIDTVDPDINEQSFVGTGPYDASFNTDDYSASGDNTYKVTVVADMVLGFGTDPGFDGGEPIIGGTSNARGRVFGQLSSGAYIIQLLSGTFEIGETITGQNNASHTGTLGFSLYQTYCQCFKNGVSFEPASAGSSDIAYPFPSDSDSELTDDIFFDVGGTGTFWTTHQAGDYWVLHISQGGADTFQFQIDGGNPVSTGVAITGTPQSLGYGISIQFVSKTGHEVGDFWEIEVNQSISDAWVNFYFTVPSRKPGEGNIAKLPSNFWTMAPQENVMYVNTQHGQWVYIEFQLSSDLISETVLVTPLKQDAQNKVLYPYTIGYSENNLIYVTERKTLDMIGRKAFVELPQVDNLSDPVKLDFLNVSFENGSIEFFDKKTWITSPDEGVMFCYDWIKGYWQPPQVVPENGILSIVEDSLISHSNLRNQTNTLFVNRNDNGKAFEVNVSLPYNSYGNRWQSKVWTKEFIEGYIKGSPGLVMKVYQDVNGCSGIQEHTVSPIICIPPDLASLGKGYLGSHGLGNDPQNRIPYFQEIYAHPSLEFYHGKIEVSCKTLDQDWGILSMGLNAVFSNTTTNKLISNSDVIIQ